MLAGLACLGFGCDRRAAPWLGLAHGSGASEQNTTGQNTTGQGSASNGETDPGASTSQWASAPKQADTPEPKAPQDRIVLQPLGDDIPDAQVDWVKSALSAFYDYEVRVQPRVALPKHAFYAPRQRYRAEKLLPVLERLAPDGTFRVLGITASDISTTKGKVHDWGILGLATIDGRACVISSFRTRRGARNPAHAMERFAKTAVHEIGHTFGLEHCPTRGCLMQDGKGSVFTTDTEYDLCIDCRKHLARRGFSLADAAVPIPWPDPKTRSAP